MPARWFRPRIDWWLLALPLGAMVGALVLVLLTDRGREQMWGVAVVGGAFVLIASFFAVSGYCLEAERLVVQVGFLQWAIPLERVKRVRRGGWWYFTSSFRVKRLRAAFSHKNLVLETAEGVWREVVVSPADEQGFLDTLRTLAPRIRIDNT
ncbi:MAG: PH domain-containing protein [Dehalococcoidia bacterium]